MSALAPARNASSPAPRPASSLDEAILRAVLYADVFDYPLTPAEIFRFLPEAPATLEAVTHALAASPWLQQRLAPAPGGYWTVRGRAALAQVRAERARHSARLWRAARRWAAVLGGLPFVRMVAVTGALAVDNAGAADDIDFLVVTAPGRVWLARALIIGVVRAARLAGARLCPNYVLARSALAQAEQDLFVAHDFFQMRPLVGPAVYAELRAANRWAEAFLPHGASGRPPEPDCSPRGLRLRLQQVGERLLGGRLGDALEAWEQSRKLRKFAPAARQPGSAARLDAERVKGHFTDHGRAILQAYQARLVQHALVPAEAALRT